MGWLMTLAGLMWVGTVNLGEVYQTMQQPVPSLLVHMEVFLVHSSKRISGIWCDLQSFWTSGGALTIFCDDPVFTFRRDSKTNKSLSTGLGGFFFRSFD